MLLKSSRPLRQAGAGGAGVVLERCPPQAATAVARLPPPSRASAAVVDAVRSPPKALQTRKRIARLRLRGLGAAGAVAAAAITATAGQAVAVGKARDASRALAAVALGAARALRPNANEEHV